MSYNKAQPTTKGMTFMDMKEIAKLAQEIIEKITSDEKLMAAFKKDPVALIDAIKAKITVDEAMDVAGKLLGMFKK